jgi:hypothetical protein
MVLSESASTSFESWIFASLQKSVLAGRVVMSLLLQGLKSGGQGGRSLLVDGLRSLQVLEWETKWPELCIKLGFVVRWDDGTKHVPELVRFQMPTRSALVITMKPLAQQARSKWPEMAEALRRQFAASVATWLEVRPGVLEVTLGLQALPTIVEYVPSEPQIDRVRLGLRAGGGESIWTPFEIPHVLITGTTNSGKGVMVRLIAHQVLVSGWSVYVVNPKRSGEFGWLARHGVPVISGYVETAKLLKFIEKTMMERQAMIEAREVGSWLKLRDRVELPDGYAPIMVIVDEAASLLLPNKADKKIEQLQNEIGSMLANITAMGRSSGVHVAMLTQRPDTSGLGPAGGQLRNNIDGRIAVGSLDADGLRMVFGSVDPETRLGLRGVKGRALTSRLTAGDVEISQIQGYYVDEEAGVLRELTPAIEQGKDWSNLET